ncbi:MAG: hypothetical protein ACP5OO_03625 [Chloroflexia bacterium]
MFRRRRQAKEEPLRRLVRGILTLLLTALAEWLAGKLTDLILGAAGKPRGEAKAPSAEPASASEPPGE